MSKLDIKSEMRAIDTKDRKWYDSLTDEEKSKLRCTMTFIRI